MILPRDWPAELVRVWRQLERQLACDDCDGIATTDDG